MSQHEDVRIGPHPSQRGLYRLQCRQHLPAPREEVFAFFANAHALEEITPPWLRFHVLTPAPIEMRAGTLIDYRLKLHGIPIGWRSEISVWEPPHRFVDEMRRGPYRSWHHLHTFTAADGGTLVEDVVDYGVPGGALIHRWLVGRDLRRIFEFRREKLATIFASGAPAK
jgi:ligand-binding SRPBCC domain-containing protein